MSRAHWVLSASDSVLTFHRRLNYAVDGQHRDVTAVVREFLKQRGMIN